MRSPRFRAAALACQQRKQPLGLFARTRAGKRPAGRGAPENRSQKLNRVGEYVPRGEECA